MKFNYAFITYRESNSALEAVNTQPYLKLNDDLFNIDITSLAKNLSPVEGLEKK